MAAKPKITDIEIRSIVQGEILNCDAVSGSLLANERTENLNYYFARPFGNEIPDRSKVVSNDVRDTVEWIMPSLMRIFTAGEDVVEFDPEGPEDVANAKQATQFVNYIWTKDNQGFLNFYSWFKDALISKNGVIKIWWDSTPKTKRERYSGLDDVAFADLVNDPDVEVAEHTESVEQIPTPQADPQTMQISMVNVPTTMHDLVLTRTTEGGKVCVDCVAPEEFLISRNARSIETARLVGHRTRRTRSSLIEDGFPKDVVDGLSGDDAGVMLDQQEIARNTVENYAEALAISNVAMQEIWVTEAYIAIDVDGDGIAEMRKITVAGTGYDILSNEAWDMPVPFASLTPIIMPHRFYGLAIADLIRDIQLIKSTIMRQYLDNLYLSNNQREEVVEGNIIEPAEVLSSKPGGKIRVKSIGSVAPIIVPQIGAAALEGLNYIDQLRENRTGVSERTQGLGSTSLHDTAAGERILMSAAMGKIELIARVFAETGVRDAFRMILKLVCEYQQKERIIRLTNNWVPMDPASWNADMDMTVSVGVGTGDRDMQIQHGMMIAGMQEKAFPLGMVTPENMKNTADLIVNAMGIKGTDRFFTVPQPGQAPQGQQKSDPEMAKVQGQLQLQQQEQTGKMQLQQAELQNQLTIDTHRNELEAQVSHARIVSEAQLQQQKLASDERIAIAVAHINANAKIAAAEATAKTADVSSVQQSEAAQEGV